MQFLTDAIEWRNLRSLVDSVILPSKRLPDFVFKQTWQAFRFADDGFLFDGKFASRMSSFLTGIQQADWTLMVLEPDGEDYFHRHFGVYPVVCGHVGTTDEEFREVLNRDPGNSPADALIGSPNLITFFGPCQDWIGLLDRECEVAVMAFQKPELAKLFAGCFANQTFAHPSGLSSDWYHPRLIAELTENYP